MEALKCKDSRVHFDWASFSKEEQTYMINHPEIQKIMNDYLSYLLQNKPTDVFTGTKDHIAGVKAFPVLKPLVFAGPSGVGKGTILKRLLKENPAVFTFSISCTTRNPRAGETHGVEYFFVTHEEFKSEIEKSSFIEHCDVHGQFYGTNQKFVHRIMNEGKVCILEIDIQGAEKIKANNLDCNHIFFDPPSFETLKERLLKRGTETPEQVTRRLATAERELARVKELPYFTHILNDDLEACYKQVVDVLNKWYPSINLQIPK